MSEATVVTKRVKTTKITSSGSVGRAAASNSRGPRVESSHWSKIYIEYLL